jgi:hypothetical protein
MDAEDTTAGQPESLRLAAPFDRDDAIPSEGAGVPGGEAASLGGVEHGHTRYGPANGDGACDGDGSFDLGKLRHSTTMLRPACFLPVPVLRAGEPVLVLELGLGQLQRQ